ncbi:MAG: hypothetical protein NTX03_03610 [Bacteroidetes bacterium]|nr:hypothetical protein [Bacteroidota bacterium]
MKKISLSLLIILCVSVAAFSQKKKIRTDRSGDEQAGTRYIYYGAGVQFYHLTGTYFNDIATAPTDKHLFTSEKVNILIPGISFYVGRNFPLKTFLFDALSVGISPNLTGSIGRPTNLQYAYGFSMPVFATIYYGCLASQKGPGNIGVAIGAGYQLTGQSIDFAIKKWLYATPEAMLEFNFRMGADFYRIRGSMGIMPYKYNYPSTLGNLAGPVMSDFSIHLIRN